MKSADDIGLDKIFRTVNRTIDMAFRSKIYDGIRTMFRQQLPDQITIANIALHKNMLRIARNTREIFQITGVGQLVQINYRRAGDLQPSQYKVGTDKTGAAGHKYGVIQSQYPQI